MDVKKWVRETRLCAPCFVCLQVSTIRDTPFDERKFTASNGRSYHINFILSNWIFVQMVWWKRTTISQHNNNIHYYYYCYYHHQQWLYMKHSKLQINDFVCHRWLHYICTPHTCMRILLYWFVCACTRLSPFIILVRPLFCVSAFTRVYSISMVYNVPTNEMSNSICDECFLQ